MDPAEKIQIAKDKKEIADQAFKAGDIPTALLNYHEALLHLHGLDKNMLSAMGGGTAAPPVGAADEEVKSDSVKQSEGKKEEEKLSEVDDLIVKIYSNQCACQIKKGNWRRAVETADKALAKSPKNWKILLRKGKALGEMGYIEKALKVLEEAEGCDGADKAAVQAEIKRIKAADKERQEKHERKFRGFLKNREGKRKEEELSYDTTPAGSSSTSIQSTDTATTSTSTASGTSTLPALTSALGKASLEDSETAKPLEPSGLVEVSEEEFERAKKARA